MKCNYLRKSVKDTQCNYCVYPDMTILKLRDDEVGNLKKIRSLLIRKLLMVEKRLLGKSKK